MPFRQKAIVILAASLAALLVLFQTTSGILVKRNAEAAERASVEEALRRVQDAVGLELETLEGTATDWANWDDTYRFMLDRNRQYIDSNFVSSTFESLDIKYLILAGLDGEILHAQGYDPALHAEVQVPESLTQDLSAQGLLTRAPFEDVEVRSGAISIAGEAVLAAAAPVLDSEGQGRPRGTFVIVRSLNATELARLEQFTSVQLSAYTMGAPGNPEGTNQIVSRIIESKRPLIEPQDDDRVAGYTVLEQIDGAPLMLLKAIQPRTVYNASQKTSRFLTVAMMILGTLLGALGLFTMERLVFSRISRLADEIVGLGGHPEPGSRISEKHSELPGLAHAINDMLESLDESRLLQEEDRRELAASKEFTEQVLDSLSAPTMVIGADHRIMVWNRALEQLTGCRSRDMVRTTDQWRAFYSRRRPVLADLLLDNRISEARRRYPGLEGPDEQGIWRAEGWRTVSDGSRKYILFAARMVNDPRAADSMVVIEHMRDFTERREAEEALTESEAKFRVLAESSVMGIYVIQRDRFLYCNPTLAGILGYSVAELRALPNIDCLMAPGSADSVRGSIVRRLEGTDTIDSYVAAFRTKGGKTVKLEVHGSRVTYDGRPAVMGMVFEVTAREKAKKRVMREVERRRLRETELLEMKAKLEEANARLARLNEKLEDLSLLDSLTGIGNRRRFDKALQAEWARAIREGRSLCLVMADIDSFKAYNDTYGHVAGDDCLRAVGAAIARTARRPADLPARYGGEEFAIILPETDLAGALAVAETARQEIESLQIEHRTSRVCPQVTVSVGVAVAWPEPGVSPYRLVRAADLALYEAKSRGCNRVESVSAIMRKKERKAPPSRMVI